MNSMEQAPGEYRLKITGLSIRQIKDIFENEYGALMWSGGGAYPCDGVTLQFKSTDGPTALPDHSEQHLDMVAALPVGELTDEQIDKVGVRFPGDQMVLRGFARAILAAASSQPVRKPLSDDQIMALQKERMLYQDGVTPSGLKRITRAIEAAHGITKKGAPSAAKEQTP